MTKFLIPGAIVALALLPSIASAQALPAPVIGVVDVQRASSQCTACKTALATLEGQVNGLKTLQTSLEGSLRTEASGLQTAVNALNGKQPDAALSARIDAFQKKEADAQRQLAARNQGFQRNRAFVLQQIGQKLDPALASVQARRGATLMLDTGTVLKAAPALDLTNDVIAALNASLTSISTTAPAQAQTAPQGR